MAAFSYLVMWVFVNPQMGKIATSITVLGASVNAAGILMRWIESYQLGFGRAPLSNLYVSLVFFAWVICVIYLIIEFRHKNRTIGVFVTPLAFLCMAYASLSPGVNDRIDPLIPALQSNWLIAHVTTCFIGYGAFALAFGISLMCLLKEKDTAGKNRFMAFFPESKILNELNYRMVLFGFLFLSLGIITGAVWANSAWGRYWGWDPKETWSLITWFIYAAVLHARMVRGWGATRIAYLSIMGFMAVLFTYFGVNYLPGLHSYASG